MGGSNLPDCINTSKNLHWGACGCCDNLCWKKFENSEGSDNEVEESSSEKRIDILENIHTNVPFSEVPHKNRKLKAHETRKRLAFEVGNGRTKPKPEKAILGIKPELPYWKRKIKGEGYERRLDKWPWKPKIIKSLIEESLSKEPLWVLTLVNCQANYIKWSVAW